MPKLQIIMQDAPRKGFSAFMPSPYGATTPAASSAGSTQAGVKGYPGNLRVPSPAPAALNDSDLGGPLNQPSRNAPDYFLPSIYWVRISSRLSLPGFKRVSTNVAPVPAPYIARGAGQTQRKPRIGGRTVTAWPRQFTRWPTYRELQAKK
jgi:hypothetical protein